MNNLIKCLFLVGLTIFSSLCSGQSRQVVRLNFDWQFKKGALTDSGKWETVQLPHDASISGTFSRDYSTSSNGWLPYGSGLYRKTFSVQALSKEKQLWVQFDGVYRDAQVWINGKWLGRELNGYLGFEYNITPYIHPGKDNILEVYYDNTTRGTSRWYTGEGIYRDVWLKYINKISIPMDGTCITTPKISLEDATVIVETEVTNAFDTIKNVNLQTDILDKNGNVVVVARASAPLNPGEKYLFRQEMIVPYPALWDLENPNLYTAVSRVFDDTQQTDLYQTQFGIREITLSPEKGLILNGKKIVAVGGDLHHDLGCIGSAALESGYAHRLKLLKDMGCNSVRLSHNPHSPLLLSLCDKMGILVFDEAYDKWTSQYYGGSISFGEGCKKDIERFVRRDRNHPSVYIWSVGNEVNSQFGDFEKKFETAAANPDYGVTRLEYLKSLVNSFDPSRKVTAALFPSRNKGWYVEWENYKNFQEFMKSTPPPMAFHMDVMSCNYTQNFFTLDHKNYPQLMFINSEASTNLGNKLRKIAWLELDTSFVIGYYYWSANDYLGESQWPAKTWTWAFYDLSDEMTALGYLHESFFSKKPMVHSMVFEQDTSVVNRWERIPAKSWSWYPVEDHWNWSKYKKVKINTFTNCEEAELLLNGKSQGRKLLKNYKDSVITWEIPYQAGVLKTIGRNKGKIVDQHTLITSGEPSKILLQPDRSELKADGLDLSYLKVKLTDINGVIVPDADVNINFEVKGEGVIAGVCNGDTYNKESYQSSVHRTYHGKCLLVVRSGRDKGQIVVTARAEGLPEATCILRVNTDPVAENNHQ